MARQLKLSYLIEGIEGSGGAALDGISRKLDAFGRSYAGIAAMVGGGIEIKAAIDEDSYFRQLAALTNTALPQMQRYKEHMQGIATESKIAIDEMNHAQASFRTAGGGFDTFDKSAKTAADSIAVLGGQGEEVGRVMATLDRSFDLKGPDKLRQGMALVIDELGSVNADFGAFARAFPDISERYAALGQGGMGAVRDLVAVYGTLATTARSPRQAFGAVNSVLDIMQTEHGRLGFQAHTGIAMQDGQGHALALPEIIANIARASQNRGQRYLLEEALPADAIAAIQKFTTPEGQKTLREMLAKGKTPADVEKLLESLGLKAATATSGIGGSLQKVQDKIHTAVDGIVDDLDRFAPALDRAAGPIAGITVGLGLIAGAGGAVTVLKTVGSLLGVIGGGGAAAAAAAEGAATGGAALSGGAAIGAGLGVGGAIGLAIAGTLVAESGPIAAALSDALDDRLGIKKPDRYDDAQVGMFNLPIPRWQNDWIDRGGRWIDHQLGLDHPGVRGPQAPLSPYAVPPGGIPGAGASALTRGIRNNNPLNLEFHSGQGAAGSDGRFGVFDTLEHGLAAEYRQLLRYQDRGFDTVDKIVHRWAPASENDDSAYERDLLKGSKFGAHDRLNLRDPATASWLLAAMARHESGARLNPSVLQRAIADVTKVGGEIVIRVEAADGTRAKVASVKASHPNVPLTASMGVGMVAP